MAVFEVHFDLGMWMGDGIQLGAPRERRPTSLLAS